MSNRSKNPRILTFLLALACMVYGLCALVPKGHACCPPKTIPAAMAETGLQKAVIPAPFEVLPCCIRTLIHPRQLPQITLNNLVPVDAHPSQSSLLTAFTPSRASTQHARDQALHDQKFVKNESRRYLALRVLLN